MCVRIFGHHVCTYIHVFHECVHSLLGSTCTPSLPTCIYMYYSSCTEFGISATSVFMAASRISLISTWLFALERIQAQDMVTEDLTAHSPLPSLAKVKA